MHSDWTLNNQNASKTVKTFIDMVTKVWYRTRWNFLTGSPGHCFNISNLHGKWTCVLSTGKKHDDHDHSNGEIKSWHLLRWAKITNIFFLQHRTKQGWNALKFAFFDIHSKQLNGISYRTSKQFHTFGIWKPPTNEIEQQQWWAKFCPNLQWNLALNIYWFHVDLFKRNSNAIRVEEARFEGASLLAPS